MSSTPRQRGARLQHAATDQYSGGAAPRTERVSRSIVAATVAGNAMEFYDFTTYAFFAVYIGKTFFPASTPLMSLLLSVAVFGVGFVTRPIGGVLIGAFADRAGRKPAMLLTIALITVGTLGLALTPSYASIGMAAPFIVVLCRLVQGLALGGEVGPSTAFLIEIAPSGQRGLYGSWQLASQGVAALVAGLIGVLLTVSLTPEEMLAWGWRVPFILGLALIPIAIYLRRRMPETLEDGPKPTVGESKPAGIGKHTRIIVLCVLVVMGGTVSTYVGNYMTTYAISTLKLSPVIGMTATVVFGLATLIFALVGGWLCDRYGRKSIMVIPRVLLALLTYPAFMLLIEHTSFTNLLIVTTLLGGLTAISGAASIVTIPELLPSHVRALGMSIAYAVGVSVFGGTTQFIITWLIGATGNPAAPAWYVTGTSVITVLAMLALPETGRKALER
ncbi:MFS transporter [Variovorax humicola]|uniref:MFS transporter n=1 Tax=Variovorax humicola TaxID=1769758 RepID=A0ABU8VWU3_9BURK